MEGARPIFSGATSLRWNSWAPQRAAYAEANVRSSIGRTSFPKVRELRQLASRYISWPPSSCESFCTHLVRAGCVILHCSAARVKLSVDATARK